MVAMVFLEVARWFLCAYFLSLTTSMCNSYSDIYIYFYLPSTTNIHARQYSRIKYLQIRHREEEQHRGSNLQSSGD